MVDFAFPSSALRRSPRVRRPSGGASRSARTSAATAASGSTRTFRGTSRRHRRRRRGRRAVLLDVQLERPTRASADSAATPPPASAGRAGGLARGRRRARRPLTWTARGCRAGPAASPGTRAATTPAPRTGDSSRTRTAAACDGERSRLLERPATGERRRRRRPRRAAGNARAEVRWRSIQRPGVVAPGLPLGTVKPRKRQGGESALSALSAPDAARVQRVRGRRERSRPLPGACLRLRGSRFRSRTRRGASPSPGRPPPGTTRAARRARRETRRRRSPGRKRRPRARRTGPSASAKPKIGAGPETGATPAPEARAAASTTRKASRVPPRSRRSRACRGKVNATHSRRTREHRRASRSRSRRRKTRLWRPGSVRHPRAEQSGPARIGATRAGVSAGPPAADVASAIPTRLGGGGCPRRPPPAERKRREPKLLRRAGRGGQELRRARLPAPRAPRARLFFFFFWNFSAAAEARDARTRTRPPPRTRLPRSRHDTRLSPFYPRTARLRYGARRARRRRGRTRTRPGAPARRGRGGERVRGDTRTTARFFRSEAPIGSSSGRHRRTIRALRTKTRGTRIPTIPSRSRRRRTCPATFPTGWSWPRPAARRRTAGGRRARRSGGGFGASSLSPSSRHPPLTAKATRTVSAPSSVRRSAARRAYRCAGSVRSSACSVRKNTTSCLYVAETDGRARVRAGRRDPPDRVPRKPPRRGGTPAARLVPFSCRQARRTREKSRAPCVATEARAPLRRVAAPRPQRLGARRALVRLQVELRRSKASDVRSARCSIGQSREALAARRRRNARGSVVRARRSARSVFHVFRERNARSFWLTKTRVSERHRLALDAGTHPSVLPVLPGAAVGGRLGTRAPAAPQTRTSRTTRANAAPRGRHGARSVRVYLPRSKNSRETAWARLLLFGELAATPVRRGVVAPLRPARAPRRTRARAHTAERDRLRGRRRARGKRSFVARLGMPRASLVG